MVFVLSFLSVFILGPLALVVGCAIAVEQLKAQIFWVRLKAQIEGDRSAIITT